MPMKELFKQYAAYNLWANAKALDAIYLLSQEQQHRHIESSFSSLYKTVFHVWRAEAIWWSRMQEIINPAVPEDKFNGSMEHLGSAWMRIDEQWLGFVNDISDLFLSKKLHYQNMKGELFSDEVDLILLHLFNHGTYHRGQIVTMLRQAGAETIPNTDFIAWARMEGRKKS